MSLSAEPSIEFPPGPDLPGRKVAQLWMEHPIEFWEDCASRFGDTVTIELGSLGTTVLFGDPEAVRQVFQLPPESFECRPFNGPYNALLGSNSLLVADGAAHRRMKRMIVPPLHKRLPETYGDAMRKHVKQAIEEWPVGQVFSPRRSMHIITLKTILEITFGGEDELAQEIVRVFSHEVFQELGSFTSWTRFARHQPRFRKLISESIKQRRAAGPGARTTLFDVMAQARDDSGELLDDVEIQDHVFTMLLAGVDPPALGLSWGLYWIHEDPTVLDRLRQELDELGPEASPERVAQLPFLTAVCLETLRMYPIATTPTGRKLIAPAEIQGRRYPPGVTLLPCTHMVHHRADLYPEPARFRPERFLERQYGSHEYFPMGGGARTCVGSSLAPIEMRIVLGEIVRRCDLTPMHEGPVRPAHHGLLLAPSDSMKFILTGIRREA
jgi:cytochrome P450 family 110